MRYPMQTAPNDVYTDAAATVIAALVLGAAIWAAVGAVAKLAGMVLR